MTTFRQFILVFCFIISGIFSVNAQVKYQPNWKSLDSRPVPAWFTDAKFGIFIHWGLFSVPAWAPTDGGIYDKYAEWYWARLNKDGKKIQSFVDFHNKQYGQNFYYQDFVSGFKAELFKPELWAEIIKNSGARYVVLTSKHHEGFTLWPSAQSPNWNSVDVGPHRDLCGDLTTAVKQKGLHMGFYYSLYEWFNPQYPSNIEKYVDDHMIPQLKDLVTRYEPDVVWTDGEWEQPSSVWKSTEFLTWLYNESLVKNTVVVNDRWGTETRSKHGGIYTTEYDLMHDENVSGKAMNHPWEECRGIGGSFGYNRNENLENYETSESLIHILIDKVSRGGNLLLNVGPTADGRIPVIMQQRLADMGAWLKVNGEAIYGTTNWGNALTQKLPKTHFFTRKGKDLYLIVTKWESQSISVKGVKNVKSVKMLGLSSTVSYKTSGNSIAIVPPTVNPNNIPCNYAWVYKLENAL